jgi:hypothetical protein
MKPNNKKLKSLMDNIVEYVIIESRQEYLQRKRKVERMSKETIRQKILTMMKNAENLSTSDAKLYQIYLDVYREKAPEREFDSLLNKL